MKRGLNAGTRYFSSTLLCVLFAFPLWPNTGEAVPADAPPPMNAAEIQLALQKLERLGRVLYVAAHPDDENTTLIAYWANGALYDTGYLSLTRGDGGQNLIGPELREPLGLIRTQELLAARRIDHGQQFFTRANDFGFSKSSEETLRIWDREKILADVVRTIRRFRPDVIVTRFAADDKNTHGHHSASAQLAAEAFALSGDATKFPEQLTDVQPWSAKRLLWNTSRFFYSERGERFDTTGLASEEVGGYQPLLGLLFPEIAALSRSMHKSQGFGTGADRTARREYFKLTAGAPVAAGAGIFEGIDTSWTRVVGKNDPLPAELQAAIAAYRPADPAASVPALLKWRTLLAPRVVEGCDPWLGRKLGELDQIIAACLGLRMTATTDKAAAHPGEELPVQVEIVNRSARAFRSVPLQIADDQPVPVTFTGVQYPTGKDEVRAPLSNGEVVVKKLSIKFPESPYSQPYWLRELATVGTYQVTNQKLIGRPENPPALPVTVELNIGGQPILYVLDTRYRHVDPVAGEVTEPLVVAPPAFVELPRPVFVFGDTRAKTFDVRVEASTNTVQGQLVLEAPAGWQVEPVAAPLDLHGLGSTAAITFKITPPVDPKGEESTLRAVLVSADGKRSPAYGRQNIRYPHIDPQTLIPPAEAKLVRADIRNTGRRIGYVPGAGDAIPESLREIGADVKSLDYDDLHAANLAGYAAVVFGVRAYNVQPARFTVAVAELRAYAEAGGVVIYQYNTAPGPGEAGSLPFPLHISHDRVTDETAEVSILAPDHPLLNTPNRITAADFAGWVQERGLYFPDHWDPAWTPLLACHDPGEVPLEGGLLVARCGRGAFIYTGYSWFRELPAGVPGAYRLFANMISLGKPQ